MVHNEGAGAQHAGLVGARFWVRAGAQIIDLAAHTAIWVVVALLFGMGLGIYAEVAHADMEPLLEELATRTWYGYLASGMGFVLYHAIMEQLGAATVGKQLTGLAVVNTDGGAISFLAALGRSLALYVDGLFLGIPAFSAMKPPLQQRLGDQWCGTVVVKRSTLPRQTTLAVRSFTGSLGFALLADSSLYVVTACIKLT
jgi:uncharacterized RDD family membrane protein YckC